MWASKSEEEPKMEFKKSTSRNNGESELLFAHCWAEEGEEHVLYTGQLFTAGSAPAPNNWGPVRGRTGSDEASLPAQAKPAVMGRQWCLIL